MNRGLVGILVIAGLLAAAYLAWLFHKKPIGHDSIVSVVLSVDGNGTCVQSGEDSKGVVTIQEGLSIDYAATDPKIPFSVNFGAAGVVSTGSPFPYAATTGWQLQFTSAGGPVSTTASKLTFPEWLFNVTDFPYKSITIDGKACTVRTGGGVRVER
jgi:hypothetical protein